MAFEELKADLSDAQEAARDYLESSAEYYKLRAFKFVMRASIALAVVLFVGALGSLAVFFLSIAASITIGDHFGNYTYGFLIVGGFYMVLGIIGFALREKLESPILRIF